MKSIEISKALNTVWLLLIFLTVISALLWLVYTFNIFSLQDVLNSFLYTDSLIDDDKKFEDKLTELLSLNSIEINDYQVLELSSDKAKELIYSFEPPINCFWEVETISGTISTKKNQTHRIYKKGDKIRIDTVDKFSDMSTVFSNGTTIIKNNKTGEIRKISNDTDFSYDNIINLASLEYLFSDSKQDFSITSVEVSDGGEFLYISIPKRNIDGNDEYFVSLKHGIVYAATSTINDEVVFSQKTTNIDITSIIADETFDFIN